MYSLDLAAHFLTSELILQMSSKTFGTAINCMDGMTQKPVIDFVRNRFNVDYVTLQSIRRRLEISKVKHQSRDIAVVGQHDCAGNPVEDCSTVWFQHGASRPVD